MMFQVNHSMVCFFFSSLCRQVLLGIDEMEGVFDFEQGTVNITVTGDDDVNAAIVRFFITLYARISLNSSLVFCIKYVILEKRNPLETGLLY